MEEFEPVRLLPEEGIRFTVACRTAGSRATPHEATLTVDWELLTPHDLDVERIGVALGGRLTCVELADRVLPAVRAWQEHLHRARRADLVQRSQAVWRVADPVDRCECLPKKYRSAAGAARHLRTVDHWRRASGWRTQAFEALVDQLGLSPEEPRNPTPRSATAAWLAEPGAVAHLWDAGVPVADVPGLWAELSPHRELLPVHIVIAHAYASEQSAWVASFAPHGELVLSWATQHRGERDERRPGERLEWVEAGIPLPTIDRVFSGAAYDLTDARAYASATGTTVPEAAGVLGRWQASGTAPPLTALVELHREIPFDAQPLPGPPQPAVERTVRMATVRGLTLTPVDAALALARCGTAPDAVAHLERLASDPRTDPDHELADHDPEEDA